jgi:hypothetical protein
MLQLQCLVAEINDGVSTCLGNQPEVEIGVLGGGRPQLRYSKVHREEGAAWVLMLR